MPTRGSNADYSKEVLSMSETVEQGQNTSATAAREPEKTFTQDEVNAIISDRLAREKEKYADYDAMKQKAAMYDEAAEASKSELQKATEKAERLEQELRARQLADAAREARDKVSRDTGVPVHLLTGEDEDTCKAQAQAILDFAKPAGYPKVRDGGEVTKSGKAPTRNQFADWLNDTLNKED